MSYWELRQWIESSIPWWAPFAAIAVIGPLLIFGKAFVEEWRREPGPTRDEVIGRIRQNRNQEPNE